MPVTASSQLRLQTKVPGEAIAELAALLARALEIRPTSRLDAALVASSHPGVLQLLASRLPARAKGFRRVQGPGLDAGEFLAQVPPTHRGVCSFGGALTEHMAFDAALALCGEIAAASPAAVRSTAFTLLLRDLGWLGAPPAVTGSVCLVDRKHGAGKYRFFIELVLEAPGDDLRAPSFVAMLQQLETVTGMPFGRARRCARPDAPASVEQPPAGRSDPALAALAFHEAFEQAGTIIRARWPQRPALAGLHDAADVLRARREEASGRGERVALPPRLKQAMAVLPGFKLSCDEAEVQRFRKPLGPELALTVAFERRTNFGLGKAFTVALGVAVMAGPLAGFSQQDTLFRLWHYGAGAPPTFVYGTRAELDRALTELVGWLGEALPDLEAAFRSWLPPPDALRTSMPDRGAPTASEGLAEAVAAVTTMLPGAMLVGVSSRPGLARHVQAGPGIDARGRLARHGAWMFRFADPGGGQGWLVELPACGTARLVRLGLPAETATALEGWLDSDEALPHASVTAREAGVEDPLAGVFDVQALLEARHIRVPHVPPGTVIPPELARLLARRAPGDQSARWTVRFLRTVAGERRDVVVSFGAGDGGARKVEALASSGGPLDCLLDESSV